MVFDWHDSAQPEAITVRSLCISVALCLATSAAAQQPPKTAADHIAAAVAARKANNHEDVLKHLRAAHALAPDPNVMNNIGRTLEELGRYREASDAYTSVANDPDAAQELRSLDASRAGALIGKLGKAWLVFPSDSKVHIGGQTLSAEKDVEVPSPAGEQVIEYVVNEGIVALRWVDLKSDQRTTMRPILTHADARLVLTRDDNATGVVINGYRVLEEASGLREIRLTPGTYELTVQRGDVLDRKTTRLEVGRFTVSALVPSSRPPATPGKDISVTTTAPASSSPYWQGAIGGLGLAALGVGTWLSISADGLRDEVRDATANDNGVVTGITLKQAAEKRDDANARSSAAIGLYVAGGAAAVAALAWLIVDLTSSPAHDGEPTVRIAPTLGGISVFGGF